MNPRLPFTAPIIAAFARGVVSVVLLAHPRGFRRRFAPDILIDLDDDVRNAAARGHVACLRAAATGVADAVAALRVPIATADHDSVTVGVHEDASRGSTMNPRTWLADGWHDLRLALRGFGRERLFAGAVIATLALGIGVNAAMFGVVDRLLVSGPEHVRDAERVRRLQVTRQPPGLNVEQSGFFGYVVYDLLRRNSQAFEAVAAYSVAEDGALFGRGATARRINRGEATASFFPLLGVTPALGRFFNELEDDPATPQQVAVLGYGVWQRDFGGREDVVGQSLVLNDAPYRIVGVAPRGFTGPDLVRVDVWIPESLVGRQRSSQWTSSWNTWWLSVIGRLKPEISGTQADAEVTGVYRNAYPGKDVATRTATLSLRPLRFARDGTPSMESRVSTWLLAVAVIVLVVACANVINLVLAHAIRRRREIAVRAALGAGRGRLLRLLVAEALALAAAGGAAGLVVAYVVGTLVRSALMPAIEWPHGVVGMRVLVVSAIVSLAAGLVVGVMPALQATTPDVVTSLKTGARDGGGRRNRVRAALTVIQASLSALLLIGAGLFVVSLWRVRDLDLGLQPDRVLTFRVQRSALATVTDPAERQRESERRAGFYPMVLERLRLRPDIEAASLSVGLAFSAGFGDDIRVPGRDQIPTLKGGGPYVTAVTAEYFKTVGTRIVRGRAFTAEDRAGSAPVAIVDETMAATLWPGGDAIGKCFHVAQSPACAEIVGIAADARHFRLREEPSMSFYLPLGQEQNIAGAQLLVRPRRDAGAVLRAVRQELMALDPTILFVSADLLQDRVDPLMRPWRLGATMFSLMGVLALVVAAVGLYSLMSYFVSDRRREIGVRMALGARPGDVIGLIVRGGVALVGAGVVIGLGVAVVAGRLVEPLLFETSPRDPRVFALVALTLITMAVLATVVPAVRARRVNPVEALRAE